MVQIKSIQHTHPTWLLSPKLLIENFKERTPTAHLFSNAILRPIYVEVHVNSTPVGKLDLGKMGEFCQAQTQVKSRCKATRLGDGCGTLVFIIIMLSRFLLI
jgi:hypothetical protein